MTSTTLPVLYSLRNCPFAMRARIAIYKSQQAVALRELVLSNKPPEFIAASPKATVPTLVLPNNKVIDESIDVMLWALHNSDPKQLLRNTNEAENKTQADMLALIKVFDTEFKPSLEAYKCAKRYHEANLVECRQACEVYIQRLEDALIAHKFVFDNQESMADIAIMPFIRQFAKVERKWYLQSPYPKLKSWLVDYLQSAMFTKVMAKYPLWSASQDPIAFGDVQ